MTLVTPPRRKLALLSLEDRLTPTGAIGNFVWSDTNGNGVQEAGEPGVAGVTVRLINNGATVATTTTSPTGTYVFDTTNLAAGSSYWLQFTVPAGYSLSPLNAGGNDNLDNDFYSNGAGDGWTDYISINPAAINNS